MMRKFSNFRYHVRSDFIFLFCYFIYMYAFILFSYICIYLFVLTYKTTLDNKDSFCNFKYSNVKSIGKYTLYFVIRKIKLHMSKFNFVRISVSCLVSK